MSLVIRDARPEDEPFLWDMLYEAAHMWKDGAASSDVARTHPFLSRYLAGWGRPDDVAVVAEEGGARVGAAWVRLLDPPPPPHAEEAEPLPELGVAVAREARGRGLGAELVRALMDAARPLYPALMLTVRDDNPARRLYERAGFRVTRTVVNRVGGSSFVMRADLLADPAGALRLVEPGELWERRFQTMAREYYLAGDARYHRAAADVAGFLGQRRRFAGGEGLPADYVPETMFWAAVEETLVGVIRLRHRLTPQLEHVGGHIGYDIRPALRGRGCGTRMLALCLERARAMGIARALITCDDDNPGSARVIEKNGGVLEDRRLDAHGTLIRRYWV